MNELVGQGLSISVPPRSQAEFWQSGWANWCWLFRKQPAARVGDLVTFRMNRKPVATARIRVIAAPGTPGWRTRSRWVVAWDHDTFTRLADEDEAGFVPKLNGGYKWAQ